MGMNIDEARRNDFSARIQFFAAMARHCANRRNAAVFDCDITLIKRTAASIGNFPIPDDQIEFRRHCEPPSHFNISNEDGFPPVTACQALIGFAQSCCAK